MRHVLSNCNVAVQEPQLRFNLRHDPILLHIVKQMLARNAHPGKRIIADVKDHSLPNGGTIPPEVMVSGLRPDLVMIDEKSGDFEIFELTCPADDMKNINNAQSRKSEKYAQLPTDIRKTGVKCEKVTPFEVCALGNIPEHARTIIRYLVGKRAARDAFKALPK